jgi:hypothetical protein
VEARTVRSRAGVAVRLAFILAGPQPLFLFVRGPEPSCAVVGALPIRGRAGENVVRFAGRIRSRVLEPGVYVLTVAPDRRAAPRAESQRVRVVSPRRTVPLASGHACAAAPSTVTRTALLLRSEDAHSGGKPVAAPARPSAPLRPPTNVPAEEGGGLPPLIPATLVPGDGTGAVELVATFGAFALVLALLFGLLSFATRLIRGNTA